MNRPSRLAVNAAPTTLFILPRTIALCASSLRPKKPHGRFATEDNYFQTIRYAWNSETPLAVLTDFEQFHVLDCRYMPDIDTALNRRIAKYYYSEYVDSEKFAEIYWLFSREAVADGSLEKRAKELPKPRAKPSSADFSPVDTRALTNHFSRNSTNTAKLSRARSKTRTQSSTVKPLPN